MTVRPWRTGSPDRPAVAVPPAPLPRRVGRRPLKRWRYVGLYGDDVHLCIGSARIGPFPLTWWALWDRGSRTLVESTHRSRAGTEVQERRAFVSEGPVTIDLAWDETDGVETISPHGPSYIWTRKQVVRARGLVSLGDRSWELMADAIIDDSAGYHARVTQWTWSAGTGTLVSGERVAWNLVDGVHDDAAQSERTIWVNGAPRHVEPVRFEGLDAISFATGERLEFAEEAVRARRDNLLVLASTYAQPFGTFTGSLPGLGPLARGHGVMEWHDVKW